jgi:hypothetical protein
MNYSIVFTYVNFLFHSHTIITKLTIQFSFLLTRMPNILQKLQPITIYTKRMDYLMTFSVTDIICDIPYQQERGGNMFVIKHHITIAILIISAITIVLLSAQCDNRIDKNRTAEYLSGIEIQYETPEQRKVIKEALTDMLSLDEAKLRNKKYPDTFKKDHTIPLEEVMRHHFVPDDYRKTPGPDFYRDLQNPEVRKLIEELRAGLKE